MLFNSFEFALFFPIVTLLFFLLPHRFRWILLLSASCFFYMFFKPIYILILFFTIVIDYFAGIWIAKENNPRKRKYLLALSIVANIGVLVVFKYYNFIAENINLIAGSIEQGKPVPLLQILLPIGLSFHTFQAMSYTIEVYRGKQAPEKHFGIYALYVMFYPQLVAGPIERPQNIIYQFYERKQFSFENMRSGLLLMAWGFFKKVVIADRLALFVNEAYANPGQYTGIPLIVATVFFAFQIFCDFSGYSDIAIGSARCMGYNLMTNFDRPYLATSISEFWRRWHISLSTWFRDYVYIPLGGSKTTKSRWYVNLMVVFLLSGVWHGANWTFVIWGFLHGLYLISENEFYTKFPAIQASKRWWVITLRRSIVFILVVVAWVFFRAVTVKDAFHIVGSFFTGIPEQLQRLLGSDPFARLELLYLGQPAFEFLLAALFIMVMIWIHRLQGKLSFEQWVLNKPKPLRWSIYYCLLIIFVCLGVFNRSEFIYFQF